MKPALLLLFAWLFVHAALFGQENLVVNFDLELEAADKPKAWYTVGSVDYYRNRSLLKNGTAPTQEPDYPQPFSGKNYLGLRSFQPGTEIAVARFSKPLIKDAWYRISCMALTSSTDCKSDLPGLTVYASDSILTLKSWFGAQPIIPFLVLKPVNRQAYVSFEKWTELFAYYRAAGGEKFLWVGLFADSSSALNSGSNVPYSSAKEGLKCKKHIYCDLFKVEAALAANENTLTLRNITFNSGSFRLAEVADSNLIYLVKYLQDFPNLKIKVEGHTDNDGSALFNQNLSEKRAEAVKNWLVEQGIDPARIHTIGYGNTKPLNSQTTSAQKALNRRVEIVFLKN